MAASNTEQQVPSPGKHWPVHSDPTYRFTIRYPNGFVIQPQDVSKFAQFTPTPVTSTYLMNPTMAAGRLAGIEPPDLEVRVYRFAGADSLKNWLVRVGFAPVDGEAGIQPYRNASISGLKICQTTMIAPGCSIYVRHGNYVYQLTPASLEGEAMIRTFALLP